MTTVLHLGCGRVGSAITLAGVPEPYTIVTLDADRRLSPDLVCTLGQDPIPLPDASVDVALAIHVLEHIGRQGETAAWFFFWEDLYRVLTPGGKLQFESPLYSSVWAWADPSHTRALSPESFVFFAQESYRGTSGISPYRIACDFRPLGFELKPDPNRQIARRESVSHFRGVLEAVKPLRPWWEDVAAPATIAQHGEGRLASAGCEHGVV